MSVTGWAETRQKAVQGREDRFVLYRQRVRSRACVEREGRRPSQRSQLQVQRVGGPRSERPREFLAGLTPDKLQAASYQGARREN